jgi:hypothetical protein
MTEKEPRTPTPAGVLHGCASPVVAVAPHVLAGPSMMSVDATAAAAGRSRVRWATASPVPVVMVFLRYLDLVILALALPVFVLAGFPMLGYAAAAVAWLIQRLLQVRLDRAARESEDLRRVAGITAGSMIGRGWLTALTIFAAGLKENDAGLAAAVLVIVLFTVYFAVTLVMRPFDSKELSS